VFVADAERDRKVAEAVLDAVLDDEPEPEGAPLREPVGDTEALRDRYVTLAVAEADMDVGVRVAEDV